jgi:hypothetical protein
MRDSRVRRRLDGPARLRYHASVRTLVFFSIAVCSVAGCASVSSQAPTLVEYQRSGGIAGRDDRLVVHTDGTARLSRRGAVADFTVGRDTLAQLRSILQTIGFEGLRTEYLPPRQGADLFEYVVVYDKHQVRTMDTAVPPELQPLIQLLNGLLTKSG